jgi:sterol desaturase/sphingolipid hydroxylase (fatty acid hydroxylase superfamily)
MAIGLNDLVLTQELQIRIGFFLGILAVLALWEWLAPRRVLTVSKLSRWANNLGMVFVYTLLLRVIFPAAAVGMAAYAHRAGWGVLNIVEMPSLLAVVSAVVVLDFAIYVQHVLFHVVPALWRLHRVHHADLDFDVTTGLRFHPIEIVLSLFYKCAVIALLGPSVLAVVIFEVLLNATSMFNHSNVRILNAIDARLRLLLVTPDMHRVHHSIERDESNSDFGFNLPWWDRLLGSYRSQPRAGHEAMTIGLGSFRDPKICVTLWGMLTFPFVGEIPAEHS